MSNFPYHTPKPDFLPVSHPFIIAEAGINHNGNLNTAKKLIDAAINAGADAVKFQSYQTELLVSGQAQAADYQQSNTSYQSQFDMLKEYELTEKDHKDLHQYCRNKNILFLSTPYDRTSVDLLENLDIPLFKIGSGDANNLPFLRYVAKQQKPMILSTGMSTMSEVHQAIDTITKEANNEKLVLLHCTSEYPARIENLNLRVIHSMQKSLSYPIGYSDHSRGIEAPVAATAMGACVIEKHFTLDRNMDGPDHQASLEPEQFTKMVQHVRNTTKALGKATKYPTRSEIELRKTARKSIILQQSVGPGDLLTEDHLQIQRPGTGIPPVHLKHITGMKIQQSVSAGTPLQWCHFQS